MSRVCEVLFERGQGWLRWGLDERTSYYWEFNAGCLAPEWYTVAPPMRRLALYLGQWLALPRLMLIGMSDKPYSDKRYRFSWDEACPQWPSDMKEDPE